MKQLIFAFAFVICCSLFNPLVAQISSTSDGSALTQYAVGPQDQIFVFCSQQGQSIGSLSAQFSTGEPAAFEWYKYNSDTGNFDSFQSDNSGQTSSSITNLADGAYRVVITVATISETYTAWVFNSWYVATAEITESNCEYFQLQGNFSEASLVYTDLNSGGTLSVNKNVRVKWEADSDLISSLLSPALYYPPAENTTYQLTVYDDFGCSDLASVIYESIVPEAAFIADPIEGEAPLEVTFTNQSVNADEYEWFFYRDIEEIREEAARNGEVSDSIMDTGIDTSPVYTFEESGQYMVKLVATKNSTDYVCRDTLYLDSYIEVSASQLDAPNFFTPNGDGSNDTFLVYYQSMQSMTVKIFNRWGKLIHSVKKDNLGSFTDTEGSEVAWDGKISGRLASPGVYYYVIEAVGRDDVNYKKQGFFHLFREK